MQCNLFHAADQSSSSKELLLNILTTGAKQRCTSWYLNTANLISYLNVCAILLIPTDIIPQILLSAHCQQIHAIGNLSTRHLLSYHIWWLKNVKQFIALRDGRSPFLPQRYCGQIWAMRNCSVGRQRLKRHKRYHCCKQLCQRKICGIFGVLIEQIYESNTEDHHMGSSL